MAFRRNRSALVAVLAFVAAVWAFFSLTSTTFAHPYLHQKTEGTTTDYWADVGYFADGTSIVKAGNAINHGEPDVTDPHTNGAPLVASTYMADVGYFVDGTSMIRAGNALNHGEPSMADPHTDGSPLPSSKYMADIGYFVDGTDVTKAGNALNHA